MAKRSELNYFCWYAFFLALIFIGSCKLSDDEKDLIINVDDEFVLDFSESLGDIRSLVIKMESVEIQDCLNSTIDHSVVFADKKLQVYINDVVTASDCVQGEAVATSNANAGNIPIGNYEVEFDIQNTVTSIGQLEVSAEQYDFQMNSRNGLVFRHFILKRIPESTIWGYVAYDDEAAAGNKPVTFLADIASISKNTDLPYGFYGHFDLQSDKLQLRESPNRNFLQTFYFSFDGELDDISNLLEQYRSTSNGALELKVFTWNGEEF